MKNEDIKYVSYFNVETQKYEVMHVQDGAIMDDIDSKLAAQAIAQLACLGHIARGTDGSLYITDEPVDDEVETIEDFIESFEEQNGDDGPELEDEDVDLCPPRDELEQTND